MSTTSLARPIELKPMAVFVGLNSSSTPEFSEQILLHKLKNELARSFDLSKQKLFEIALEKLKSSSDKNYCNKLRCILDIHATLPRTSLFLLKKHNKKRITLILIGENKVWRVKHEVCTTCILNLEDMLKTLVLRMESYIIPPIVMKLNIIPERITNINPQKSIKQNLSSKKTKNKTIKNLPSSKFYKKSEKIIPKTISPLDKLQFKIAERQYNQLIWKKIKKDLMFFRQKNNNPSLKSLKARLRLQIDPSGKVVERRLLRASGSVKFDKSILNSVDMMELPPPMDVLIRQPPYVVTILIQP